MAECFFFFDLGNVLVKFDHRLAVQQIAELSHSSLEQAQHVLFDSGLQIRYETGLVTNDEFCDAVNEQLGAQLQNEDILNAVSAIFVPNDEILVVLQHIKSAGVGIGLLSNTCDAHWQWLLRQSWPMVQGWFDPIVLSYEIRSMKPDRAIYEYCERKCGFSGAQIFFTDDRADNIAAAEQIGWHTYQYGTPTELLQRFNDWRAQFP
jgi:glucose-1-phosphatase